MDHRFCFFVCDQHKYGGWCVKNPPVSALTNKLTDTNISAISRYRLIYRHSSRPLYSQLTQCVCVLRCGPTAAPPSGENSSLHSGGRTEEEPRWSPTGQRHDTSYLQQVKGQPFRPVVMLLHWDHTGRLLVYYCASTTFDGLLLVVHFYYWYFSCVLLVNLVFPK